VETQVEHKSEFTWGGLALNVGIGAVTGAIGGALGSIGGAALKAGAGAIRQGVKAAGQAAWKAAGREAGDILSGKITGGVLSKAANSVADSAVSNTAKGCNSFTPGTPVLMASGGTKPIEEIQPGDLVLAGDPQAGKTAVHAATATITGHGTKHLVEISIDVHESAGQQTSRITATANHPFWVANRQSWTDAGSLQPGDQVLTATGERLGVLSVRHYTAYLRVFNLTVESLHTYYVMAGGSAVLVHNSGGGVCDIPTLKNLAQQVREAGNHFLSRTLRTVAVGQDEAGALTVASSNGLDAGQQAMARTLGIRPITSLLDKHAEETLIADNLARNGGTSTLRRVASDVRAPCGLAEHNCAGQLDALGIEHN